MQSYVKHPKEVPLKYESLPSEQVSRRVSKHWRMRFTGEHKVDVGAQIEVSFPVEGKEYCAKGLVDWVEAREEMFEIGVDFYDFAESFKVRMLEQSYQAHKFAQRACEKVALSEEELERLWVKRYSFHFPQLDAD